MGKATSRTATKRAASGQDARVGLAHVGAARFGAPFHCRAHGPGAGVFLGCGRS